MTPEDTRPFTAPPQIGFTAPTLLWCATSRNGDRVMLRTRYDVARHIAGGPGAVAIHLWDAGGWVRQYDLGETGR